jgi:chemotaxis protein methyltransferase CheR
MTDLSLRREEFGRLRQFVHKNLGIFLADGKMSMVEQRLRPLVVGRGFSDFRAFVEAVEKNPGREMMTDLVNRITTNHTYFNREPEHFRFLEEKVLPEHVESARSSRSLRMWCAAASRGHEPYTLAMIQRRVLGRDYESWDAGLLATDISEQALSVAVRGRYPAEEADALPEGLRKAFMHRLPGGEYEVSAEIRREVLYRKFNLHTAAYPFKRPFDVVFCRNVLIYFDMPTKLDVVRKITEKLRPGGYLFVGLAESLGREVGLLSYLRPGVYRRGF